MILNCVGLIDRFSTETIRKITQELSKKTGSNKALDFTPHFSIRNDFEINEADILNLKTDISQLLKNHRPLEIRVEKYGFYPWKIIYLEIEPTALLLELHSELMNVIQKYRTPWVSPVLFENQYFKGKQREYVKNYGYHLAFEYYSPHFTVAGNDLSDKVFKRTKEELKDKPENLKTTVEKIAFMNREKNNSIELEFPLDKSL